MQKWRRFPLAVVALLALLASVLPSSAWSCPMTGRIGSAAFVCQGMKQPCAGAASTCCRVVTLPPGGLIPQIPQGEASQVLVAAPAVPPLQTAPIIEHQCSAAILRPEPLLTPAAGHGWDRAESFVRSRHGPPLFSGRAPPPA